MDAVSASVTRDDQRVLSAQLSEKGKEVYRDYHIVQYYLQNHLKDYEFAP